ncbi:MAG TPA: alpha/beta fold hydrolase [Myxococcales bacterium]|jgi:pimeloyl-ACP methyl ester carboxylesterase/DNA-binding CsgD family transcriptional regulator|nr:alpha/beta fold hydrolase [Myxococcales bacterium]
MELPATRYARSGDVHIAWQTLGQGPDLIFVPGWVSHVEANWRFPEVASFLRTLAARCRLIVFDKRGTGLSDPMPRASTMEERMDDVRAVMDAAQVRRAVVFGASEGVSLSILFAATYPERTLGLIAYAGFARRKRTPDYPWAPSDESRVRLLAEVERAWGGPMDISTLAPSHVGDARFAARFASYLRQSASPGAATALLRYNTEVDSIPAMAHVAAPTLVLHRAADRDAKLAEGKFIAAKIAGARFVELPGADHWCFAGQTAPLLEAALKFVGELPSIPRRSSRRMPQPPRKPPALATLTARQRQILELLAQGHSNREIARMLYRSEHTVHRHVANILDQLAVKSRAQAVSLLMR